MKKSIISNVVYKAFLILFVLIGFQRSSFAVPCDGSIGEKCCIGANAGCGMDACLLNGAVPQDGDICDGCTCDTGLDCKWTLTPPDYQDGEGLCQAGSTCATLGQPCVDHDDCCDSGNIPGAFCKDLVCQSCGGEEEYCCPVGQCDDEDKYSCARTDSYGFKRCCEDTDDDNFCDDTPTWTCGNVDEACCNINDQPCNSLQCYPDADGVCSSCTCNTTSLICGIKNFGEEPRTICYDESGCGGRSEVCCPGGSCDPGFCCDGATCEDGDCLPPPPPNLVYTGPVIEKLEDIIGPVTKMLYYGGLALGIFFIILSGYRLMTSEGDPQRVKGAQEQLTSAIIGIVFILLSVTIIRVIIDEIINL